MPQDHNRLILSPGDIFGRLTVMKEAGRTASGNILWLCSCECGNETKVTGSCLKGGDTKSCGCLNTDKIIARNTTHGLSKTRIYELHHNINQRCYNPKTKFYKHYGGRGIKVCEEWKDFLVFYEWCLRSGYEEGLTIERIDVNGNYCPENCTWISSAKQHDNTTRTIIYSYNGESRTLPEWGRVLGIKYTTLRNRITRNPNDLSKVFSTPVKSPTGNKRGALELCVNGIIKTVKEWGEGVGLGRKGVIERIDRGWTLEEAVTIPKGEKRGRR